MKYSELYGFAAQCLTPDLIPEFRERAFALLKEETQAEAFVYLCSNHFVLPVVWQNLKDYDLQHVFTPELQEHLDYIQKLNQKRNLEILDQVVELCETLHHYHIEPVFLKGTANLLDGIYGNAGERMIGDIDMLVQEKDYLLTASLVQELGYRYDEKVYDEVGVLKHFPRLYKPDVPADIEIHRIPVTEIYSRHFSTSLIFSRKKAVTGLENCFVPCDDHKAVLNFIHDQLGNYGYWLKRTSLRYLYDSYRIGRRLDYQQLLDKQVYSRKMNNYFVVQHRLALQPVSQGLQVTAGSERYYRLHNWFLDHEKVFRFFFILTRIYQVFFKWGLFRMHRLFIPRYFKGIIKRLKDPEWYKNRVWGNLKNWYLKYF